MISVNSIAMKAIRLMNNDEGMTEQDAVKKVLENDGHDVENLDQSVFDRISQEINRDFEQERTNAEEQLRQQSGDGDRLVISATEAATDENTEPANDEIDTQQAGE